MSWQIFWKSDCPLIQATNFPQSKTAEKTLEYLKTEIENAIAYSIDETVPFTEETDVLYLSIAASRNQSGKPVAFFLRILSTRERKHSSIEKEA